MYREQKIQYYESFEIKTLEGGGMFFGLFGFTFGFGLGHPFGFAA